MGICRSGMDKPYLEYRRYEPSNKWGTVETTIEFLERILTYCKEYPTAVIEVSC